MLKRILKNKVAILSCLLGLAIGLYLSNSIPETFAQKVLTPLSQGTKGSYTAIPLLIDSPYDTNNYTKAVMVISPTGHVWYVDVEFIRADIDNIREKNLAKLRIL